MKSVQNKIVGWVAKWVGREAGRVEAQRSKAPRELDERQLKQVAGGTGTTSQAPNRGW